MKQPLFFRSSTQKNLIRLVIVLCIFSIMLEFFMNRKSYFADSGFYSLDSIFGFYGILGFAGCAFVMIIYSIMSVIVKVGEGFYNNDF